MDGNLEPDYPYGGTEISNFLSDHKMISSKEYLGFSNQEITIVSYNTWGRGTRGGFDGVFPGYGDRKEPNANLRVKSNLFNIINIFSSINNALVCIQEWSNSDLKYLKTNLDSYNLKTICQQTEGQYFNNCIIYNPNEFWVKNNTTKNFFDLDQVKNSEGDTQKNRYQRVQFIHRGTFESLEVVNVHLRYSTPSHVLAQALDSFFNYCQGSCFMVGDFNHNLLNLDLNNITKKVSIGGTASAREGTLRFTNTDAILFKSGSFYDYDQLIDFSITHSLKKAVHEKLMSDPSFSFDDFCLLARTQFKNQKELFLIKYNFTFRE